MASERSDGSDGSDKSNWSEAGEPKNDDSPRHYVEGRHRGLTFRILGGMSTTTKEQSACQCATEGARMMQGIYERAFSVLR